MEMSNQATRKEKSNAKLSSVPVPSLFRSLPDFKNFGTRMIAHNSPKCASTLGTSCLARISHMLNRQRRVGFVIFPSVQMIGLVSERGMGIVTGLLLAN
jgi:hypothetical protein